MNKTEDLTSREKKHTTEIPTELIMQQKQVWGWGGGGGRLAADWLRKWDRAITVEAHEGGGGNQTSANTKTGSQMTDNK